MEIVQMIIFFAMNIQNALKLQHLVKTNAFLRNNQDSKIKASTGIEYWTHFYPRYTDKHGYLYLYTYV